MQRGGFHQRLKRHAADMASEGAPQGTSSKLASVLLQKWCWGLMSLPMLQLLASSAIEDGLDQPLLRSSICMWVLVWDVAFCGGVLPLLIVGINQNMGNFHG